MTSDDDEPRADAAISAVAGGSIVPVGRFSYDADADLWWWSDEMYRIHGFDPGQVTPSTELLLDQRHPSDRRRSVEFLARALARADSFSTRYRIVDAQGRSRTVLSAGRVRRSVRGDLERVTGYVADLTMSLQRDSGRQPGHHARPVSSAGVERAIGALIAVGGLNEREAKDLLQDRCRAAGGQVQDVAAALVVELGQRAHEDPEAADRIARALDRIPPLMVVAPPA